MPITAQHPAVVSFDATHAYLINPSWAADSAGEHSLEALRKTARSRNPLAISFILVLLLGTVSATVFHDKVADLIPLSGDASDLLAYLGFAVIVAIIAIPLIRRFERINTLQRGLTRGPHGAAIQRINNYIEGSTDQTPGALLWNIISAYERMELAMEELDEALGEDPSTGGANKIAAAKRTLLHEVDTVDRLLASHPGLSSDTAEYREFATTAD